jgi:CRP-like cAMP-binding protein
MKTTELKGIRILADLSLEQLGALAEHGAVLDVPASQLIFEQGQPADAMYFIMDGKVGVYAIGQGGGEVHLRTLENGGHFGEIGLLQAGTRTANVRTITPCKLFRLDKEAFQGIVMVPELATPFLHGLSRSMAIRLADVTNRFADVKSFKDVWAV